MSCYVIITDNLNLIIYVCLIQLAELQQGIRHLEPPECPRHYAEAWFKA